MNETIARIQMEYQDFRELTCYSIFDTETRLIQLAEEGKIWIIQGMKDLTIIGKVLITHLLNEKRELQIYDLF